MVNDEALILGDSPLSKLSGTPPIIIPRISGIVNSQLAPLPEIKGTLYHGCVNILESILTSDARKIAKLRDMLSTTKLSHGHTRIVPYTTLDAYQKDAK